MQDAYANPEKAKERADGSSPLKKLLNVFGEGVEDAKVIREAMEDLLKEQEKEVESSSDKDMIEKEEL